MIRNGKGMNFRRKLELWSPSKLEKFIEYKAEDEDKKVVYVNPKHTSQKCSKCGFTDKNNRHSSMFKYRNCGFELNADLNASRNIEVLGKSEYFTFLSTNRCGSMKLHSCVENSSKLQSFSEEYLTNI